MQRAAGVLSQAARRPRRGVGQGGRMWLVPAAGALNRFKLNERKLNHG